MFKAEGVKERGENGFVVFNDRMSSLWQDVRLVQMGGIGGTYAVMPELFVKMDELIQCGQVCRGNEDPV